MSTRTAMGKYIDMAVLMAENEEAIAVGNARMNARGDQLGANGVVIKKKEEIATEYNRSKANTARKVPLTALDTEVFSNPADALKDLADKKAQKAAPAKPRKISDSDE